MEAVFTVLENQGRTIFTCPNHVLVATQSDPSHVTLEDERLNVERFDCPTDELPELAQAVCDGVMVLT